MTNAWMTRMARPVVLLCLLLLSSLMARAEGDWYSVQVKAVPPAQYAEGIALYEELKGAGYLAYYYQAPIKGALWLRIRVGVFASPEEAAALGKVLREREGLDFFSAKAPAEVRIHGGVQLIKLPSGVWYQRDGQLIELHQSGLRTQGQMVDVAADVTPDGRQVAILHDRGFDLFDVESGQRLWRSEDITGMMPRVRYSPDGQWLAFQPMRDFEGEFALWLMPAAGGEPRALLDPAGSSRSIRSFAWAPGSDGIYYVESHAWGTMSFGGRLMHINLEGASQIVLEPDSDREQFGGELEVRERRLHYQVIRFDAAYMRSTTTPAQLSLP